MGRRRPGLLKRLWRALPEGQVRALEAAISITGKRDADLYLVGGAVRDLLLRRPLGELDLVVEVDPFPIAWALGRRLKAKVVEHARFGTTAISGASVRLDLARARTEFYPDPGALPVIEPATLDEDLGRRDFTISAMALRLTGPRAGEMLDPFEGERDLAAKRIRILHDDSFQDDATRMFRAVRYAGRFDFEIERRTSHCVHRDAGYIDTLSGTRVRHELEHIAREERPGEIVRLAHRFGLLEAAHPALGEDARGRRMARELPALVVSHRDAVLFCLLLVGATADEAGGAIGRLVMTSRQAKAVAGFFALGGAIDELAEARVSPSRVVELLAPRPAESVEAMALVSRGRVAGRLRRYLDEWRFVRTRLNGRDLERLGVARGPEVGSILRALLGARLDGKVTTKRDEEAFVRSALGHG